jgi:hypothetical protein
LLVSGGIAVYGTFAVDFAGFGVGERILDLFEMGRELAEGGELSTEFFLDPLEPESDQGRDAITLFCDLGSG